MPTKAPPAISKILEICGDLSLGLFTFWKTKGMEISWENIHENIFLLSTDLAKRLNISHELLVQQFDHMYKNLPFPAISPSGALVYPLNRMQIDELLVFLPGYKLLPLKKEVIRELQLLDIYLLKSMDLKEKELILVSDALEICYVEDGGIELWKIKGIELDSRNFLQNVFILSSDLATHLQKRHDHLLKKNIVKLQQEKYLPEQLPSFVQMVEIGSSARKPITVYGLNRLHTPLYSCQHSKCKYERL